MLQDLRASRTSVIGDEAIVHPAWIEEIQKQPRCCGNTIPPAFGNEAQQDAPSVGTDLDGTDVHDGQKVQDRRVERHFYIATLKGVLTNQKAPSISIEHIRRCLQVTQCGDLTP